MPLEDYLDSTARVRRPGAPGPRVEGVSGHPGPPELSETFDCYLYVASANEPRTLEAEPGRRERRVQLLVAPQDRAGGPVRLRAADELLIHCERQNHADGLPADAEVLWAIDGDPAVMQGPGRPLIGLNANLLRVDAVAPITGED